MARAQSHGHRELKQAEKCNLALAVGGRGWWWWWWLMDFMNCLLIFCQRFLPTASPAPHLPHLDPSVSPPLSNPHAGLPPMSALPLTNLLLLPRSHTQWKTVCPSKFTSTLMSDLYSLGQSRCTPITTWVSSHPRTWDLGVRVWGSWGSEG